MIPTSDVNFANVDKLTSIQFQFKKLIIVILLFYPNEFE